MEELKIKGQAAKAAASVLAAADTEIKNAALHKIAEAFLEKSAYILAENQKDIISARKNGISDGLIDRLTLNDARTSPQQMTSLPFALRAST